MRFIIVALALMAMFSTASAADYKYTTSYAGMGSYCQQVTYDPADCATLDAAMTAGGWVSGTCDAGTCASALETIITDLNMAETYGSMCNAVTDVTYTFTCETTTTPTTPTDTVTYNFEEGGVCQHLTFKPTDCSFLTAIMNAMETDSEETTWETGECTGTYEASNCNQGQLQETIDMVLPLYTEYCTDPASLVLTIECGSASLYAFIVLVAVAIFNF